MATNARRPPLPTYEEATKFIVRPASQQQPSPSPTALLHIRTGSDPANNGRTLRPTRSSIGFLPEDRAGGRRLPPVHGAQPCALRTSQSAVVRTGHGAVVRTGHGAVVRTGHGAVVRTGSGTVVRNAQIAADNMHNAQQREESRGKSERWEMMMSQSNAPQKPARKFPPIFENIRGKHYGSHGFFAEGLRAREGVYSDGETSGGEHARVMGSSPNLPGLSASAPRYRNSCVSLGEEDRLFHATSQDLLHHHRRVLHPNHHHQQTLHRLNSSGKPPINLAASSESLPLPSLPSLSSPEDFVGHGLGRSSYADNHYEVLPRPGSATTTTMGPTATTTMGPTATRIHTNGSLLRQRHTTQAQRQQQQLWQTATPTSTTADDLSPAEKVNGTGDHTDNVSVSSVASSGTGSDSGKATSSDHSTGDNGHHETLLGLMDDFQLCGMSLHAKSCDTWKALPEVSRLPWNESHIESVLQTGRLQHLHEARRLSADLAPFLAQALRFPFLRICMEISRLTHSNHFRCTKRVVLFAAQRILPFSVFLTTKTACQKAAAFYASSLSRADQTKTSKSTHSDLKLDVGRIHGFMVEKKLGKFVHDISAVYLTAALQNILEELLLASGKVIPANQPLNCGLLERRMLDDAEFFGLFQPWRHLQAGRNAGNKAVLPLGLPARALGQILATGFRTMDDLNFAIGEGCNVVEDSRKDRVAVGTSKNMLEELTIHQMHWSSDALISLHFFLGPDSTVLDCADKDATTPPLIEWLRLVEACASYRRSSMLEKEDVMEAARILLPGLDYPPHLLSLNDELQYFQAISKPRLLNDFNQAGLTPLMIACMRCEYQQVRKLLNEGAKPNLAVPLIVSPNKQSYSRVQPDTQNWTALHFAVAHGSLMAAKCLLDHGAWVEGSETTAGILCQTPLQLAAAFGMEDMVALLIVKGADPCLSTISEQPSCSADAQRGIQSAMVLAAAHGRRRVLTRLLSALPSISSSPTSSTDDTISLTEMLQEGNQKTVRFHEPLHRRTSMVFSPNGRNSSSPVTKDQLRLLQTVLYHAAENGFLDIVAEISYFGVVWKVHSWTRAICLLKSTTPLFINDILTGFWTFSPKELIESTPILTHTIPTLFHLLSGCRDDRVILFQLYRIISSLYGPDAIAPIRLESIVARKTHLRLNDQSTADIEFKVEGTSVYAHRAVVMGASQKFRDLLSGCSEAVVQVEIYNSPLKEFFVVMEYLYEGGWQKLNIHGDVLELMASAHYFGLPGLMRYCESVWSRGVCLANVLSIAQHAKLFMAPDLTGFCEGFIIQSLPQLAELEEPALSKFLFGDNGTIKRLCDAFSQRILLRREIISRNTHVI
ncbi:Ankyrin repeat and BTB/POZ domain-containing protein 2 [Hypsibius exemplaris]|uniref:Ankyrin repeat and BTB/POZ domain-containing protein 2 n=1 Tax=Hypsibius exemplaris TaxID=2072580 RepID=A0A1W0WDQ0_HYPEX|nr:Ankyrin repeat and BTB/POZ domain-containing protein 2 [Hypsibius exemplaris]